MAGQVRLECASGISMAEPGKNRVFRPETGKMAEARSLSAMGFITK